VDAINIWRLAYLVIGIASAVWGGRITLSKAYFHYWNNKHWMEANNGQWSNESLRANKIGVGLGAFLFGVALTYYAIFKM
jgi:hypothetical protein